MAYIINSKVFEVIMILLVLKTSLISSCSTNCCCENYYNQTRVNCSYQNIEDPRIYFISPIVYLDLSYNNVKILEDDAFVTHPYILELNLTHNLIEFIGIKSFSSLRYLHSIDLSFNSVEALHADTFKANLILNRIDLNNNKFRNLKNEPFIINPSVRFLILRNCEINNISKIMFEEMPMLQELDLSSNLLITINFDYFYYLKHLTFVNVTKNVLLVCDELLKKNLSQCKKHYIKVGEIDCKYLPISSEEITIPAVQSIGEHTLLEGTAYETENEKGRTVEAEITDAELKNYFEINCNFSQNMIFCDICADYLKANPQNETPFNETMCYKQKGILYSFPFAIFFIISTLGLMSFFVVCIQYLQTQTADNEREQPECRTYGSFSDSDSSDC